MRNVTTAASRTAAQGLRWLACALALSGVVTDAAAPPDPLPGRLFHTPAERAALDRPAAAGGTALPRQPQMRPQRRAPEQSPELSGFVLRSDGHDSYWIAPGKPVTQ